jgi:hypothetical protein
MTVEVASQVKRWQKRSVEEKRRIVEETLAAGASVARVARRQLLSVVPTFQSSLLSSTAPAVPPWIFF